MEEQLRNDTGGPPPPHRAQRLKPPKPAGALVMGGPSQHGRGSGTAREGEAVRRIDLGGTSRMWRANRFGARGRPGAAHFTQRTGAAPMPDEITNHRSELNCSAALEKSGSTRRNRQREPDADKPSAMRRRLFGKPGRARRTMEKNTTLTARRCHSGQICRAASYGSSARKQFRL